MIRLFQLVQREGFSVDQTFCEALADTEARFHYLLQVLAREPRTETKTLSTSEHASSIS